MTRSTFWRLNTLLLGGENIFGRSKFIQKKIVIRYWDNLEYHYHKDHIILYFGISVILFIMLMVFFMQQWEMDIIMINVTMLLLGLVVLMLVSGFKSHQWANIELERDYLIIGIPYIWPKKRDFFKPLIKRILRSSIERTVLYFDKGTMRAENVGINLRNELGTEWFLPTLGIRLNLLPNYSIMRLYIWPTYSNDLRAMKNVIYHNLINSFMFNGFKVRIKGPIYR